MGPGMISQSQEVCGECDGKGEVIPPSSRFDSILILTNIIQIRLTKGWQTATFFGYIGQIEDGNCGLLSAFVLNSQVLF